MEWCIERALASIEHVGRSALKERHPLGNIAVKLTGEIEKAAYVPMVGGPDSDEVRKLLIVEET